jgi:hypothetical protein
MLTQFGEVKRVLKNFAFKEKRNTILSTEINMDVLDEMRRERKIQMIIRDAKVDEYIALDMTDVNIYKKEEWDSSPDPVKLAIQDKLDFRAALA